MIKLIKKYLIAFFLLSFIYSCDIKCPCDTENIYPYTCSPREASITEFNPQFESIPQILPAGKDIFEATKVLYIPTDTYSIHSFEFPYEMSSSGFLPNNEHYKADFGIAQGIIKSIKLSNYGINLPYSFAVLNEVPQNADIKGDILVEDVEIDTSDASNSTATIMVSGYMQKIASKYDSESSKDFCEFLESVYFSNGKLDKEKISDLRKNILDSKYGVGITGFALQNHYTNKPLYVINSIGQILIDFSSGSPIINKYAFVGNKKGYNDLLAQVNQIYSKYDEARNKLFSMMAKEKKDFFVTVNISIGDVFYYRAKNGRDFIFAVINLSERPDPYQKVKKRMSIIFNNI